MEKPVLSLLGKTRAKIAGAIGMNVGDFLALSPIERQDALADVAERAVTTFPFAWLEQTHGRDPIRALAALGGRWMDGSPSEKIFLHGANGEPMHVAHTRAVCIRCGQEIIPGQDIGGDGGLYHHADKDLPACEAEQARYAADIAAASNPMVDGRHRDTVRYGSMRW